MWLFRFGSQRYDWIFQCLCYIAQFDFCINCVCERVHSGDYLFFHQLCIVFAGLEFLLAIFVFIGKKEPLLYILYNCMYIYVCLKTVCSQCCTTSQVPYTKTYKIAMRFHFHRSMCSHCSIVGGFFSFLFAHFVSICTSWVVSFRFR